MHFAVWRAELKKSNNSGISSAAKTLELHGNAYIKFPAPERKRGKDIKSPDGSVGHNCSLKCRNPALALEVEFSHNSREALRNKAEGYIMSSKGEIRTVIAVDMGEMHTTERKNERRLRKMYCTGQIDESGLYFYPTDEKNITSGASILVWRATKFQDATGNAIQLALIRIPLEDFVCKSFLDSTKKSKAPPLEISSEALCEAIKLNFERYRTERAEVIRDDAQLKEQKKREEEEEVRRRRAAEVRTREGAGVWGRVMEQGRLLLSAKIKDRRFQNESG
ncbi:hypothetical protein GGR58DRAFT_513492 [Xylaria digitata]|nr:hypothetical protein GGR58DRAFT_513492 [Xylaria digitata]